MDQMCVAANHGHELRLQLSAVGKRHLLNGDWNLAPGTEMDGLERTARLAACGKHNLGKRNARNKRSRERIGDSSCGCMCGGSSGCGSSGSGGGGPRLEVGR